MAPAPETRRPTVQDNPRKLTIAILKLTDAAPMIVARELGFFADLGLDVSLSIEPSWANIADKMTFARIDAAVMLPPLAFAIALGIRGVGAELVIPMGLSLNGNSITASREVAADLVGLADRRPNALETGQSLAKSLRARNGRLRFAVVHAFSTHNLLLRYWLAASGIDPDRSIEFSVVPPAEMVGEMKAGRIDGFCAGAPWGEIAARQGVGRTIVTTSQIWHNHPEKCLAVRRDWANANPGTLQNLLRALLRAALYCDDSGNAAEIAAILSRDGYLGLDSAALRASLPADRTGIGSLGNVDISTFFAHAANFPWRSHAAWFLGELVRWGYLSADLDRKSLIEAIYRPNLLREAARQESVPLPRQDWKIEGSHDSRWSVESEGGAIPMGPDQFCDGKTFELQ